MPGKVKVKIVAGRNLPVMDRSADTTDAYVEIKLGSTTYKTEVCRKSLNPQWNSEWYRFEVDDSELQDEPLQIRLMDYDVYSANDAIGKVYLDLNPLILGCGLPHITHVFDLVDANILPANPNLPCTASSIGGSTFSGWVPVFDTMHGIRGEVNLIVKVELFSDTNKFRQSSCGVQFFCSPMVPYGFHAQIIHGFVEELVVNDDPEYQWIDKIRTPRASNEARQTLFFKLSGEVQRKIGLKVLEIGGNAVIGYHKCFDLEGESGIVVRGIGTAVSLVKQREVHAATNTADELPFQAGTDDHRGNTGAVHKLSPSRITSNVHRRSSDSDLSVTPKGSSYGGGGSSGSTHARHQFPFVLTIPRAQHTQESSLDMMEYPFLTMSKYPPGFIVRLGGMVSARSVKLLERTTSAEDNESRDARWNELRMEVRSHSRVLACNVVLGYSEHCSICEDVCVLSASGTAAVVNFHLTGNPRDGRELSFTKDMAHLSLDAAAESTSDDKTKPRIERDEKLNCSLCHVPYSTGNAPMPVNMLKCAVCRQSKVPDIILATIETPQNIPITGHACLIQAHVFRPKKDCRGELNAKEISDGLPFLEYELHRTLVNKLRVKGMNAIFNLKVQVSIGERWLVGVATGTAVFLSPLPPTPLPRVVAGDSWADNPEVAEMQKKLQDISKRNREHYCVQPLPAFSQEKQTGDLREISDNDESEEDLPDLEITTGNKDVYVLEVDDAEDVSVVSRLLEPRIPDGFEIVNTECVPGLKNLEIVCNLQMFTQVWRARINSGQGAKSLSKHFHRLQQSLYFKLRKVVPCALCHMDFNVELPEADEIQITVLGMALGLADPKRNATTTKPTKKEVLKKSADSDLIFKLDDDLVQTTPTIHLKQPLQSNILRGYHTSPRERYGVDITPLTYVPGARINQYLGNLNFFFIRESTTLRECGGLSGFVHSFIAEVLAIVRAHVTALGGNAMVSYFLNECVLLSSSHKNQGQCLINVGGDVVHVAYAEG